MTNLADARYIVTITFVEDNEPSEVFGIQDMPVTHAIIVAQGERNRPDVNIDLIAVYDKNNDQIHYC